jgi:hypothetical protein
MGRWTHEILCKVKRVSIVETYVCFVQASTYRSLHVFVTENGLIHVGYGLDKVSLNVVKRSHNP